MDTRPTSPGSHRPCWLRAFTLVELVTVIALTAILAVAAIPSLTTLPATRQAAAARLLLHDLSYARQRALATGIATWVVFAPSAETYSVLSEIAGTPGRSGAAALADPASGQPYTRTFGAGEFKGVTITSATFDAATEVGFDWLGAPQASTEVALAAVGTVVLSGGYTISVEPGTGSITKTP